MIPDSGLLFGPPCIRQINVWTEHYEYYSLV